MTPKFDNLARLLMEMSERISDEIRIRIRDQIMDFPEKTYQQIADEVGINISTVAEIALGYGVDRGITHMQDTHVGRETHPGRRLTDEQEERLLQHYIDNHERLTHSMLMQWANGPEGMAVLGDHPIMSTRMITVANQIQAMLNRHPDFRRKWPPVDRGKGTRLMKQRDKQKKEHSKNPNYTGDVRPQHFRGSTDIVPSEPKHGGPARPPRSPGE